MAIAYFIPDQTKLLAAQNGNNNNNTQNNNNANVEQNSNQTAANTSTALPASQEEERVRERSQQDYQADGSSFRANITIPVSSLGTSTPDTVGCWDLITQIFCQALRICREQPSRQPTVIEISFHISGPHTTASATTSTSTATPLANAATQTQHSGSDIAAPTIEPQTRPKKN